MNSKKLLSLIFVMLMVAGGFSMLPAAHADTGKTTYEFRIYDSQGRLLDPHNYNVQQFAKLVIYKPSWLGGYFKQKLAEINGSFFGNGIDLPSNLAYVDVAFYWMGQKDYEKTIPLVHEQMDTNKTHYGWWIIPVNLPFTPAIPISGLNAESIKVSADLHQISTPYYSVKFGTGAYQSHIELMIGSHVYDMPVELNFQSGNNSDTKPFRFLAQSTKGYVKGAEKWLIWTTAEYWSSVRTQKVGDNMLLVVWTYGYTDVAGAWIDKVIGAAVAGAIVGAATGIGAITLGAGAGITASILWAVKPDLMDLSAHTGIGIVAGLFTPRYMIIQGISGLGAKSTTATISISNIPQSTRASSGKIAYQISSSTNEIQAGFTLNYGSVHTSEFYDFETKAQYDEWKTYTGNGGTVQWYGPITFAHSGQYVIQMANDGVFYYGTGIHLKAGDQLKLTFTGYLKKSNTGYYWIKLVDTNSPTTIYTATGQKSQPDSWTYVAYTLQFTAQKECNVSVAVVMDSGYLDDAQFSYSILGNDSVYRYIFETDGTHDSQVVRHMFGTIPTINPGAQGAPLHVSYTLLAIDMADKHGMLALDWTSPRLYDVSPARIMIKSDVWQETAWLLATNSKNGFKNIEFVIVPSYRFIYRVPIETYYYFTSPENWTWQPSWTPFIANGTMVYVPKDIGIPAWQIWNWQINKWWKDIGTWGHLALIGLAGLIILILILILAPWLIFAIVEILGLIIRGLAKAVGMAAKGAGELMKRRRKR